MKMVLVHTERMIALVCVFFSVLLLGALIEGTIGIIAFPSAILMAIAAYAIAAAADRQEGRIKRMLARMRRSKVRRIQKHQDVQQRYARFEDATHLHAA